LQRWNPDKTWQEGNADGCTDKSINQLYNENRAFDFVRKEAPDAGSMVPGIPDAMNCGPGAGDNRILWLHSSGDETRYVQVYNPSDINGERFVTFSPDGLFKARGGDDDATTAWCDGKSLAALKIAGRAFYFTHKTTTTTTTTTLPPTPAKPTLKVVETEFSGTALNVSWVLPYHDPPVSTVIVAVIEVG